MAPDGRDECGAGCQVPFWANEQTISTGEEISRANSIGAYSIIGGEVPRLCQALCRLSLSAATSTENIKIYVIFTPVSSWSTENKSRTSWIADARCERGM